MRPMPTAPAAFATSGSKWWRMAKPRWRKFIVSRWRSDHHTLRVQQDRLELFGHTNGVAELLASSVIVIPENGVCSPADLEPILDNIKSRSRLKITLDDGL